MARRSLFFWDFERRRGVNAAAVAESGAGRTAASVVDAAAAAAMASARARSSRTLRAARSLATAAAAMAAMRATTNHNIPKACAVGDARDVGAAGSKR